MTTSHGMSERYNIQSPIVKGIMNEGAKFTKPNGIISTTTSTTDKNGNQITFKGLIAKK